MTQETRIKVETGMGDYNAVFSPDLEGKLFLLEPIGDADPRAIPYIEPYVHDYLGAPSQEKFLKASEMLKHAGNHCYFPMPFLDYPEGVII